MSGGGRKGVPQTVGGCRWRVVVGEQGVADFCWESAV